MVRIFILAMLTSGSVLGQSLRTEYLKDTFDLHENYLFEHAYGWFSQEQGQWLINFSAKEEKSRGSFKLHDWIGKGEVIFPIKVLSDTTFNFTINWSDKDGKRKVCLYKGMMTTEYLNKVIVFYSECDDVVKYPSLDRMKGSDAWPGFLPHGYVEFSGKVLTTECYGMDINEPSLYMKILLDNNDTLGFSIFYNDQLRKESNDNYKYYIKKRINGIYMKSDGYEYGEKFYIIE